jgi:hypothetical protein
MSSGAVPTCVVRSPDGRGWTLLRGGAPYFIKGMGGTSRCARVAELGGNSVRTWSASDLGAALDAAHAAGLTVCAGLWVRHASLGPDWYDSPAHAAERDAKLAEMRDAVRTHKHHPALLMWAVGNEPNASGFNAHAPLWRFVNAAARLVKAEGAFAGSMLAAAHVRRHSRFALAHRPGARCHHGDDVAHGGAVRLPEHALPRRGLVVRQRVRLAAVPAAGQDAGTGVASRVRGDRVRALELVAGEDHDMGRAAGAEQQREGCHVSQRG